MTTPAHPPSPSWTMRDVRPQEVPSLLTTFPPGFIVEDRGVVIAVVVMHESGAVAATNARLLAAAPKMREFVEIVELAASTGFNKADHADLRQRARALLARIDGKETLCRSRT